MPPYTVALVGLGRIGFSFGLDSRRVQPASHLAAIKQLEKEGLLKLVGLCDISETQLQLALNNYFENSPLVGTTHPDPKGTFYWSTNAREMLEQSKPDIVVVATPAEHHFTTMVNALNANNESPKLIFCEKPLTRSVDASEGIVGTCQRRGVPLAVNHSRRWDPTWQQIHRMITDKEEMGKLLFIHGLYSGETMNVGVHMADLVNWFGAPKHSVSKIDASYLVFELAVYGKKKVVKISRNGSDVQIYDVKESIRYQDINEPVLDIFGYTDLILDKINKQTLTANKSPMLNAYRNIIAHLDHKEPLACTGKDGLEAVRLAKQWEMQEA